MVELLTIELRVSQTVEEPGGTENVTEDFDGDCLARKQLFKKARQRYVGKGPIPVLLLRIAVIESCDSRDGGEQDSAALEDAMQRPQRRAEIVDVLEGLRQDDAIEASRRSSAPSSSPHV